MIVVMSVGAAFLTLRLKSGIQVSRWQCALEIIVSGIVKQIEDVGLQQPVKYLTFIGTLFLFIASSTTDTVSVPVTISVEITLDVSTTIS
jgi:F-type H+-transporting ATPase subunit a